MYAKAIRHQPLGMPPSYIVFNLEDLIAFYGNEIPGNSDHHGPFSPPAKKVTTLILPTQGWQPVSIDFPYEDFEELFMKFKAGRLEQKNMLKDSAGQYSRILNMCVRR